MIKTFYLSNGDVTETANAIRALLGTVHVSINKQENAITMRDTADKVTIAQSIIDQNDKEKAEVVIDVELLADGPQQEHGNRPHVSSDDQRDSAQPGHRARGHHREHLGHADDGQCRSRSTS